MYHVIKLKFNVCVCVLQTLVPPDHLLLASAKRVKALILEEIAVDTPAAHDAVGE
jgi:hypothetical protein